MGFFLRRGLVGPDVSDMKYLLIRLGYRLTDSGPNKGVFGPKMEAAVADFQENHGLLSDGQIDQKTKDALINAAEGSATMNPTNPAYDEAQKHIGQGEKNAGFVAWLSGFWKKVGLNYKTIIGSSCAWCALFVVAMNSEVGQKYLASASAKAQGAYGVEIDYRKNGVPRGAVVHINHAGNCKSGTGNHVGFADGDCSAEDLRKSAAVIPILGGNQSDQVKRSLFPAAHICEVRWPKEVPLPGPITKSLYCGGKSGNETTR